MPKPARPPSAPRSQRPVIAAVGAVGLIGAVGAFVLWHRQTPPPAAPPAATALAPASAPAGALPRRTWTVGDRRRYALQTTRAITFQGPPEAPASQTLRITLAGTWETTVVHTDALAVHLAARLAEPQLSLTSDGGGGDPAQRDAALRAVAQPLFLQLDPRGALRATRVPRDGDEFGRGLLQSVAALTQLVDAAQPGAASWTATESDTTGSYEAAYTLAPGGARLTKQRSRYTQIAAAGGLMPVSELGKVTSTLALTYALLPSGFPQSIEGSESLDVDAGPVMPRVRSQARLTLTALSEDHDPGAAARFAQAQGPDYVLQPLGVATGSDAASSRRDDEAMVRGARFTQLAAQLAALGPGAGSERAALHARLEALFRLDAGAAREAGAALQRGLSPDAARTVLGSLAGAGTAAAQQALARAAELRTLTSELRSNAVAVLGLTDPPTEDTTATLLRTARDADPEVKSASALALGNAAHSLREHGQGDAADEPIEALLQKLAAATDPDEQTLYLQALGNAGDARALPAITPLCASPVPAVRAAAAAALRFIHEGQDGTVDALLAAALTDPAAEVRRSAVFSIGYREPASIAALLAPLRQALARDTDLRVRMDTVKLLGKNLALPGAREALSQAATRDPAADVRNAAQALLSPASR